MPGRLIRPCLTPILCTLALLVGLPDAAGVAAAQAGGDDTLCGLLTPSEISEAFAGELSVEVQRGTSDGCTYAIQGRSFSHLQFTHWAANSAGNNFGGQKRMVEEGEAEGELLDDLGEEAVLNMTNQLLAIRLADDSVVQLTISIYGETLRPLLDDEDKREGLLALGRLAVEKVTS